MNESEYPRYGHPERYVGKTVIEVREEETQHGEDRLVIVFDDCEHYLDVRAERLFY